MSDRDLEKPQKVRLVGALAGVGSGLTKVAVGHGFDTVKTRIQCSPPGTYSSAVDVLLQTVRNEGVFALYKGAIPPALGWSFIDSVLLGSLHNYRLLLYKQGFTESTPGSDTRRLTLLAHGGAGLLAGLTSAMIATPVELLKIKLQLQLQKNTVDRQFKSPLDCAKQIVKAQGVTGLWTGLQGSIAFRSNFFWMFLSFELHQGFMRGFSSLKGTPFEVNTPTANFFSGGLGSFVFWFFGIPFDNCKNRMMAHPYPLPYPPKIHSASGRVSRPSFFSMASQIHARDGLKGFYRGLGPSLLRAFPVNASALFVYEGIMRALNAEQTRR